MVSAVNSQEKVPVSTGLSATGAVGNGEWEEKWHLTIFQILYQKIVHEAGCKPIGISKQNVDEGVGRNFQVKFQIKCKPAKMFLKVLGNYDPFCRYWRGKCVSEESPETISLDEWTSSKILPPFQKRLFIWKMTNSVPSVIVCFPQVESINSFLSIFSTAIYSSPPTHILFLSSSQLQWKETPLESHSVWQTLHTDRKAGQQSEGPWGSQGCGFVRRPLWSRCDSPHRAARRGMTKGREASAPPAHGIVRLLLSSSLPLVLYKRAVADKWGPLHHESGRWDVSVI